MRAARRKAGKIARRIAAAAGEVVNATRVFARDAWRCQICGDKTPERLRGKGKPKSPTLDHRVPLARGGRHTYENCQCACLDCNTKKGDRGNTGQMTLFCDPVLTLHEQGRRG